MSDEREWLQALKAGDLVVVESRSEQAVLPVARVTATQIKTAHKYATGVEYFTTFRRESGQEIGGDRWFPKSLRQATPERLAEIAEAKRRHELISRVSRARLKDLPTSALEAMAAALNAGGAS